MLPIKTLITTAVLAVGAMADSQIAVYWGQNGFSGQDRLATYCQNTNMDIVLLSFLNDFPDPLNVNFANQCGGTFENSTLLHCTYIGEDIKTCQGLGKKVLLSLGGAYGSYGFTNTTSATDFADVLWNKFGGGSDDERPFDDAVVDGFDFDIEQGPTTGYPELATALKSKFSQDKSKSYYLSAAPQCPYPDSFVGQLISKVPLDYIFIQFYNNYCSVDGTFNFADWQKFADSAPNPNVQLFVGVPGAPSTAISGFVSPQELANTLDTIKCDSNFAGVSLWDASGAYQEYDNKGPYIDQVRKVLDNLDTDECNETSTTSAQKTSSTKSETSSQSTSSEETTTADPSSVSRFYGNTTSSGVKSVVTVTDIGTTVVTVTSCSENKCSATPVTTGYVVITDVNTVYTTYCPLTDEAVTITKAPVAPAAGQSTVTVTTVCHEEKCQAITKTVPVAALPTEKDIVAVGSTNVAAKPSVVVSEQTETYVSGDITSTVIVQVTSTVQPSAVPSVANAYSAAGNGTAPEYTFEGGAESSRVAIWTIIPLLVLAALF